ncbi:hypothetical protein COCON_G00109410 [Conger conger]|uniref:Uncharacterized protein n=1 Tax=Conger conger TaxID=82655 RepID=A0A9Q1I024_CONCO|nr:hypothetical protein COCON_G00109410 [Conger conger]
MEQRDVVETGTAPSACPKTFAKKTSHGELVATTKTEYKCFPPSPRIFEDNKFVFSTGPCLACSSELGSS